MISRNSLFTLWTCRQLHESESGVGGMDESHIMLFKTLIDNVLIFHKSSDVDILLLDMIVFSRM